MKTKTKIRLGIILGIFVLFILAMIRVGTAKPRSIAKYTQPIIIEEIYADDTEIVVDNVEEVVDISDEVSGEVVLTDEVKSYDDNTVEVLTNLLYGEARGIKSDMQKSAVIWCICNRLDNGHYGNTLVEVATAPNQFVGYEKGRTFYDMDSYYHCKEIVIDVLDRYYGDQSGRTLPQDYLYFIGKNNSNWFSQVWKGTNYWNWSLPNPYSN